MLVVMMIPVMVGQIPVCWSIQRNLKSVTDVIGQADTGSLLVLPEAALSGYDDNLSGLGSLDPAELSEARQIVSRTANDRGVHVVCGSLLFENGGWWNAGLYFGPDREPRVYRKVNLAMHERGRLHPGSALPTVTIKFPDGALTVGIQLCREIRFPEQWHVLAEYGAEVLLYLTYAANPNEPADVWRAHLISRAAETQRYVVAANVAHPDQHCPSMIVSPRGEVLAETSDHRPQALRHQIDTASIRGDYLSQQRADIVAITYGTVIFSV